MKRGTMGLIPKVIVGCLAVYTVVNLLSLQLEINDAREALEELSVKVERQKRENAMLKESVEAEPDEGKIADAARSELGYVASDEKLFYIIR